MLKYTFNSQSGLYEWTHLGPIISRPKVSLSEASLTPFGDGWVIAARTGQPGIVWMKTNDPFHVEPQLMVTKEPASNSPRTLYHCADGVLRLFTGDPSVSPHKNARDPLYCWDVDPANGFACTGLREVFDSVQARLPIRKAAQPKVDMCKLLPPSGRTQLLVFRVSVRSYNHPYVGGSGKPTGIPPINHAEKAACGIYYARMSYSGPLPPAWEFANR